MSDNVFVINKKVGETPLDCIKNLKISRPSFSHLPITYAGRLDPLAEGVLLLLVGDECLKKDNYLKLPKEYEVEVLLGFATDTYDVMGKVVSDISSCDALSKAKNIVPDFVGNIKQDYPVYSSRTVKGKPLFMWARGGDLDEIEVPSHIVSIYKIEIIGERKIKGRDLLEQIERDISLVSGDFRQPEIFSLWQEKIKGREEEEFGVLKLSISCGGGVYVRGIADSIGKKIGVGSLALRIIRMKVGDYSLEDTHVI
jgi:tRNA pseudouridine55 synthase